MAVPKFLRKLGLSLLSLLACAAALELLARAAEPGPFSLLDRSPYVPPATLHHVHEPGFSGRWDGSWYEINSLGMRGPELPEPTAGETQFRVVAVGDSCTFGKGVLESETWPRQLEMALAEALGPGTRPVVANLGVNGYAGRDYREIFLERGLAAEPDVVVIGYNLNDFPNAIRAVDQEVYRQRGLRQLLPVGLRDELNRSALYRYLRSVFYDLNRESDWAQAEEIAARAGDSAVDPQVWANQEAHLAEIARASREIGAEVAVFLFPYESQVYLDTYDRTPIELLEGLCGRLNIPFVSLEREFRDWAYREDPPRELFLRGDRYHPRPEGYAIVAQRVLELIREQGWLPSDG